jgi:hypothetical protein
VVDVGADPASALPVILEAIGGEEMKTVLIVLVGFAVIAAFFAGMESANSMQASRRGESYDLQEAMPSSKPLPVQPVQVDEDGYPLSLPRPVGPCPSPSELLRQAQGAVCDVTVPPTPPPPPRGIYPTIPKEGIYIEDITKDPDWTLILARDCSSGMNGWDCYSTG